MIPGPFLAAVGDPPGQNLISIARRSAIVVIQVAEVNLQDEAVQDIHKVLYMAKNCSLSSPMRNPGPIHEAFALNSRPQCQKTVKFQK